MVAMNEKGVILFIENDVHNRVHDGVTDGHFFRARHIDDPVTYVIGFHEGFELIRKVFIDEGAVKDQQLSICACEAPLTRRSSSRESGGIGSLPSGENYSCRFFQG